jgi:hypothetical protein
MPDDYLVAGGGRRCEVAVDSGCARLWPGLETVLARQRPVKLDVAAFLSVWRDSALADVPVLIAGSRAPRFTSYGERFRGRDPAPARRSLSLLAALGGLCWFPPLAPGQGDASVVIGDAPACGRCAISVRRIVTLGNTDGDGAIPSGIESVSVDSRGRCWVLSSDPLPKVFDASGRFLGVVGRLGSGPGEFRSPMAAVPVPGDSIVVLDGVGARATVFTSELRPARSITLPASFFPVVVLSWPSHLVANGFVASADAVGWPLHDLSLAGEVAEVLASFGPDSGARRPGQFPRLLQKVSPSVGGSFWSADWSRYRLTHWTAPGQKAKTLERHAPWFPRTDRPAGVGSPDKPPDPGISAVREDSTGLVWVFVKTPAPTWRSAWPRTGSREEVVVRRIALEAVPDRHRSHRSACRTCGGAADVRRVHRAGTARTPRGGVQRGSR